jgi:NADPH-dependent curcumin reductase CurA
MSALICSDLESTNTRVPVPSIEIGSVMRARGIVKVLQSTSQKFEEGQFGYGPVGWSEYNVLDEDVVRAIPSLPNGMDMTLHIGTLGLTGMTAYYGLIDIVGASKGETILISGAAGATGSMAVRIARHLIKAGKVIGIAGTDEKCRWVEKLGADSCRSGPSPCHSRKIIMLSRSELQKSHFQGGLGESDERQSY